MVCSGSVISSSNRCRYLHRSKRSSSSTGCAAKSAVDEEDCGGDGDVDVDAENRDVAIIGTTNALHDALKHVSRYARLLSLLNSIIVDDVSYK